MNDEEKTLGQVAFEAVPSRLIWEDQPEAWREYWETTARTVIAEWQRRNPPLRVDNPETDATDFAHPAWWRGHEHAFKVMVQKINICSMESHCAACRRRIGKESEKGLRILWGNGEKQ